MYIDIKLEDALKYDKVKLCYIDSIDPTYYDYTPAARAYRETEEWKNEDKKRQEKLKKQGYMSSADPEFGFNNNPILERGCECQYYPNPVFIEGEQERYAYFTPADLDKQWGDDWDDAPYEYNAEIPYDDYYESDTNVPIHILRVPFYVFYDSGYRVKFPRDWGGDNSNFSVQDINAGAVAWIYDKRSKTAINAGCTPKEFAEKIKKINDYE